MIVQRIDERLSALGNTIASNDYAALIHPDIDRVSLTAIRWMVVAKSYICVVMGSACSLHKLSHELEG